jgi:hypothetical protein
MKNIKFNTVVTVPESNRKIEIKRKIDIPNKHIHRRSHHLNVAGLN